MAVSLVQSADGSVLDLGALRRCVADSATITVIDASQGLGWMNIELPWADVVVAAGYKWLLGARCGVGIVESADALLQALVPRAANPYVGKGLWSTLYGLPLRLADDARRFDASPAWSGVLAAGLSLPWLASLDRAAVETHTLGLANRLGTELAAPRRAVNDSLGPAGAEKMAPWRITATTATSPTTSVKPRAREFGSGWPR